jgi:thiol:disulfide interchange protein
MRSEAMMRGVRTRIAVAAAVGALLLSASLAPAYLSSTWYEDASGYQDAVRQQKALHAPMFVYFRADWCPHCKAFDQLLEDPQVRSRMASIIKVRINPEHGKAERELFEQRFGTKGYPSLFLVDAESGAPQKLRHGGPADRFVAQLPTAH